MSWATPFHEGELEAQRLAGEAAQGESNGAMVSEKIMSGALNFIRAQKMAIVSSRGAQGQRWASILFGKAGFLEPGDRRTLTIAIDPTEIDAADPLWENLKADERVGILIIEFQSRRRLRINGTAQMANQRLAVSVEESYANCPKYITRREIEIQPRERSPNDEAASRGNRLGEAQASLLAASDILFLATGHPKRGADASHRGGNPGFVQVVDAETVRIPDYSGNSMFNSLGNLLVDAHFGMLIPDFQRGRTLQLTGTAKVPWAAQDDARRSGGTNRFVDFHVDEWRERTMPTSVTGAALQYSPFNPS